MSGDFDKTGVHDSQCSKEHRSGPCDRASKRVQHIVGRIRHRETARALIAYLMDRFDHGYEFTYEFDEGEQWWLIRARTYDNPAGNNRSIVDKDTSAMCEICRAFSAGRQSMVD